VNDSLWNCLRYNKLEWLPEIGIGWFPVTANPYDANYWNNYRRLDATFTGLQLTDMRMDMVTRHTKGAVVDIGIGGGRFVENMAGARGFDVNPQAVAWLHERGLWLDPYAAPVHAATFWDSLEHIHEPSALFANIEQWAFISTPVYLDADDVMRSKHYKREEHCWYFTVEGLRRFMFLGGFEMVEHNGMEREAGRDSIDSFAFKRF